MGERQGGCGGCLGGLRCCFLWREGGVIRILAFGELLRLWFCLSIREMEK